MGLASRVVAMDVLLFVARGVFPHAELAIVATAG
jgi:hypothetical protein